MHHFQSTVVFLLFFLLASCDRFDSADHSKAAESLNQTISPAKLPKACKQAAEVQDIWQLEPLLVKSGQIKENMTAVEKEAIIHQYIAIKNQQYQACLSSKGK